MRNVILIVLLSLSVTACSMGNDNTPDPVAEPTTVPTLSPTTQAETPLEVADPVWTTTISESDGSPGDSVEWFPTDADVVYAVFQTRDVTAGTAFTIAWLMNDVPVPGLDPVLEMKADAPEGWIEFHLNRTSESPWPEGNLTIQLSVDGAIVSTGTIELRDA